MEAGKMGISENGKMGIQSFTPNTKIQLYLKELIVCKKTLIFCELVDFIHCLLHVISHEIEAINAGCRILLS
jgi:hypothetical protein